MSNNNEVAIRIDNYGHDAPKAARFGVGATDIAEVNEATAARRALSNQQSTARGVTPISRDGD